MYAAVQVSANRRQIGLAFSFLSLSFGLSFKKPLLQSTRLQVLLFAGAGKGLIESWDAFRLTPAIRLDSSAATNTVLYESFVYVHNYPKKLK